MAENIQSVGMNLRPGGVAAVRPVHRIPWSRAVAGDGAPGSRIWASAPAKDLPDLEPRRAIELRDTRAPRNCAHPCRKSLIDEGRQVSQLAVNSF